MLRRKECAAQFVRGVSNIILERNISGGGIHPDFTALNKRTAKMYIFEHLGMMDKTSYYENAIQKIDTYERNGFLLGENLLITHETSLSPLNTQVLKNYIETYLC